MSRLKVHYDGYASMGLVEFGHAQAGGAFLNRALFRGGSDGYDVLL